MTSAGFSVLSRISALNIGETIYRPLRALKHLDSTRISYALCAVEHAQNRPRAAQEFYLSQVFQSEDVLPLSVPAYDSGDASLPRFPVLCLDRESRNRKFNLLQSLGLGVSCMYRDVLSDIPGVPKVSFTQLGNARRFASQLLTLPTHSGVTSHHLKLVLNGLKRS